MEKRLFIAILLSLGVLLIWNFFFPPVKNNIKSPALVQTEELLSNISPISEVNTTKEVDTPEPEFTTIENEKLVVTFSSKGGTINEINLKEYNNNLPLKNIANLFDTDNRIFKLVSVDEQAVHYIFDNDDFIINKTYILKNYTIDIKVEVNNKNEKIRMDKFSIKAYTLQMSNLSEKIKTDADFNRDKGLYEYVIKTKDGTHRKNNAYKFTSKDKKIDSEAVIWAGFRDRYYCAIIKPNFKATGYGLLPLDAERMDLEFDLEKNENNSDSHTYNFITYFGPEKESELRKIDASFPEIKRYYRNGLFDGIAKIIDFLLHSIYKLIPNWGIAIIILSLLVYFSMYPLTLRSMTSMRKMQTIQPKIAALKEKHKNNPQKMNQEMMEIYKTEKINPLGGCLPMLLQMPVFFGLYQVLWRSVDLKGAKFLWIKDLSAPDRLIIFKQSFPVIGNEFNIFPIIMIGIMILQQKVTAKNMVATDPDQIMQQKMMATVFPIMFGWIFYHFASGLTIYFIMFYSLSTITQWKMSKQS